MCAGVLVDAAVGPQVVDAAYIRHWIHYRYQACGFRRYLSDSDMKVSHLCSMHSQRTEPNITISGRRSRQRVDDL